MIINNITVCQIRRGDWDNLEVVPHFSLCKRCDSLEASHRDGFNEVTTYVLPKKSEKISRNNPHPLLI